MARKSPVGENVRLVAIELVRKASTSLPVGMSNVRIVESSDVAISHRESGEKAYELSVRRTNTRTMCLGTYRIQYAALEPSQLPHNTPGLDVDETDDQVVTDHRQ